jgi:hypothetical protein
MTVLLSVSNLSYPIAGTASREVDENLKASHAPGLSASRAITRYPEPDSIAKLAAHFIQIKAQAKL